MFENKEAAYYKSMRREDVNKIVQQAPSGKQPAFYDPAIDRYFASNPNGQFLAIDTLKRLMSSHKLVNHHKGLKNAVTHKRTADWATNHSGLEQLHTAINDVVLCRKKPCVVQ